MSRPVLVADDDECHQCQEELYETMTNARNSTALSNKVPNASQVYCFDCSTDTKNTFNCVKCDYVQHLGSDFGFMHVRMPKKEYKKQYAERQVIDEKAAIVTDDRGARIAQLKQEMRLEKLREHTASDEPHDSVPDFSKDVLISLARKLYDAYHSVTKRHWPLIDVLSEDNRLSTGSSASTASSILSAKGGKKFNEEALRFYAENRRSGDAVVGKNLMEVYPDLERALVDICVEHEFYTRGALISAFDMFSQDPEVKLYKQAMDAQCEYLLAQGRSESKFV